MSQVNLVGIGQSRAALGPAWQVRKASARRNGCSGLLAICHLGVIILVSAVSASPQAPDGTRASLPSLPGAVTQPPDWIGNTAPFDVAAFFDGPPPEQNAAPFYLNALFEFGSAVAICFPEGPERDRQTQAVDVRWKRYNAIHEALRKDPKSVSSETVDALLAEYDDGFRKVAFAQGHPRCVFQTGLGVTAVLPHLDAAS